MALERYSTSYLEREGNVANFMQNLFGVFFKVGSVATIGIVAYEVVKGRFNFDTTAIAAAVGLTSAASWVGQKEAEAFKYEIFNEISARQQGSNPV